MNSMGTWCSVLFWLGIFLMIVGVAYVVVLGLRARTISKTAKGPATLAAEDLQDWLDKIVGPLITALVQALPIAMFGLLLSVGALWASAKGYC
jgi:hypothetical protein